MTRRKKILSLLLIVVSVVSAAGCSGSTSTEKADNKNNEVTRDIVFQTDEINESRDEEFKAVIEEDGKTYQLEKITYDLIKKTPKEIEVTKTIESDILPADQTYTPQETITEDGVTYTHVSTDREEGVLEEAYTQPVTGYTDYSYPVSVESAPATKDITVADDRTGQAQTVTCSLTDVTRLPAEYEDTYIDIVYESYDANTFVWGDTVVSKNEQTPEIDEGQLLASVGADPGTYDVQNVYWTGQPYDAGGVLCRNARADVRRQVNYYRANYIGAITQDAVSGIKYISTYTGAVADGSAGYTYKIQATAHYTEQNNHTVLMIAGIGIFLLAALIIVLLYLISRKKKEKGDT